jgi:alginate O-acetyltransferase complex protein AlgI
VIFSSITFLVAFLPAVLAAYYLFRGRRARNVVLVLASALFYAWGEPRALLLLWGSIILNYLVGLAIGRFRDKGRLARVSLIVGIVGNLSLLGYFKYTDFFVRTANRALGLSVPLPHILLPAGVSFFTFLGLSYIIDLYRGRGPMLKNPLDLGLYQGAFPIVLAGPLVRYEGFAPQIRDRRETLEDISYGIERFIVGFAKKVIVAGGLATIPAISHDSLATTSTAGAWLAAFAYTGIIYFDFSGYSDMAIGLGRMFGFKLPENFNYPYASKSISEFWRRWHITMGAWFREYVYIPLGGNRRRSPRVVGNLLAVWILTGFWHGSAWTFVAWGLYYGVLLVIERFLLRTFLERVWSPIRHLAVVVLVVVGWVIFSAPDLPLAWAQLKLMVGVGAAGFFDSGTLQHLSDCRWEIALAVFGSMPTVPFLKRVLKRLIRPSFLRQGLMYLKPVLLGALLCLSIAYAVKANFTPFLYFKF